MKNLIPLILSVVFLLYGCAIDKPIIAENEPHCDVENPMLELNWLGELVDTIDSTHSILNIYECTYNGQDGFLVDLCINCSDSLVQFYTCEGNNLLEFDDEEFQGTYADFKSNVSNLELIYGDTNRVLINDVVYCVENPLQELTWLKEIAEAGSSPYGPLEIYWCNYENQEGFLINQCVGCVSELEQFYDCDGTILCETSALDSTNTCPDFYEKINSKHLIYSDSSNVVTDTIFCAENPLEEIEWLKKEIKDISKLRSRAEIYKCTYAGQELFLFQSYICSVEKSCLFFDCEKNVICTGSGIDGENSCPYFENVTDFQLIWKNY